MQELDEALRKLRESANSPVLWCICNPGKYKRDANLGSGRATVFFPPALHPLLGPNRCVRIIGTSRSSHPFRSSSTYRVFLRAFVALSRSSSVVVFGTALIYYAESTSTPENIRPRRGIVWSDDECGIVVQGLVKGEPAPRVRREIGRG